MTKQTRDTAANPSEAERAAWLGLLAQAEPALLQRLAAPILADHRFEWLRRPEQGLVMLRSRIGNQGDRFNLGEATLTRCVARHVSPDGSAVAGVGHVLGRDAEHAQAVAMLDALLQRPALRPLIDEALLQPLRQARQERHQREQAATQTSRVRFFTLQPEAA